MSYGKGPAPITHATSPTLQTIISGAEIANVREAQELVELDRARPGIVDDLAHAVEEIRPERAERVQFARGEPICMHETLDAHSIPNDTRGIPNGMPAVASSAAPFSSERNQARYWLTPAPTNHPIRQAAATQQQDTDQRDPVSVRSGCSRRRACCPCCPSDVDAITEFAMGEGRSAERRQRTHRQRVPDRRPVMITHDKY